MNSAKKRSSTQANLAMSTRPTKRNAAETGPPNAIGIVLPRIRKASRRSIEYISKEEAQVYLANASTHSLPRKYRPSHQHLTSKNADERENEFQDESTRDHYPENEDDFSGISIQARGSLEATHPLSNPKRDHTLQLDQPLGFGNQSSRLSLPLSFPSIGSMDPVKKRSATQANLAMASRPTKRNTAVSGPANMFEAILPMIAMAPKRLVEYISKGYLALNTEEAPVHIVSTSTHSLPGSFRVSPQPSASRNVDDHEDELDNDCDDESTLDSHAQNDNDSSDTPIQAQGSLEPTPVPTTSAPSSPPFISVRDTSGDSSAFSSQWTTPVPNARRSRGHHQAVGRTAWRHHVHPLKTKHDIEKRMAWAQELFEKKKARGYMQDMSTFRAYMSYKEHIEKWYAAMDKNMPSPKPATGPESLPKMPSDLFLQRAVTDARKTLESPRPFIPKFKASEWIAQQDRERDAEIERRLRPKLPESLPPEDERKVKQSLQNHALVVRVAREQVTAQDLSRLRPGQWLNDEIINFYGALITERAANFEAGVKNGEPNGKGKSRAPPGMEGLGEPWKVHYFNTFFLSKLQDVGYEKGRLNKWTKKVDIFSKDIVLIPCNLGNAHWTCAAINFRDKRIEYYDSMGMDRPSIRAALRTYLDKEHQDKKSKPFDFEGWTDLFGHDGPQQENGFDCGVFLCQTMENISRGIPLPFDFTQRNMPYLRRRMILEITTQQLPIKRL